MPSSLMAPRGSGRGRLRRLAGLVAVLAAGVSVVGCGGSISFGSSVLAHPGQDVSDALLKSVGTRPPSVACPGSVPAKAGHVFTCKVVINAAGDYVIATVEETSISGHTAQVHVTDGTTIHKP